MNRLYANVKAAKGFSNAILCMVVLFASMGLGLTIGSGTLNAEGKANVRTDISFDYDSRTDSKQWIPRATITSGDFSNGNITVDKYSFPEFALEAPAKGELSDNCGFKKNNVHWVQTSKGDKVYWADCYSVKASSSSIGFMKIVSRLYEFDVATKQIKLVKEAPDRFIDFYPSFGGYSIYKKDYYNDQVGTDRFHIYSIATNKLVKKVHSVNGEGSENAIMNRYNRAPAPGALIVIELTQTKVEPGSDKFYSKLGNMYYIERTLELFKDGKSKELVFNKNQASREWEKKVGVLLYAKYYDSKKKQWFVGYSTNNGKSFTSISQTGMDATAAFSPNNKYVIVTEVPLNRNKRSKTVDYSTTIVDAATGKTLRKLPIFGSNNFYHTFYWKYGDEMVGVYFFDYKGSKDGYLNLSSGKFTLASDYAERWKVSKNSGSFADLLSPETPPRLILDGKPVSFEEQGPFLAADGQWYVGVSDFAEAVKARMTESRGIVTLSNGAESIKLKSDALISLNGLVYAPVNELTAGFGIVAAFDHGLPGENGKRQLFLYSNRMNQEQFLATYPEAVRVNNQAFYRSIGGNQVERVTGAKTEGYATYGIYNELYFTFKDGKLISIDNGLYPSATMKGLQNYEDKFNSVIQAYGAAKSIKSGSGEILVYPSKDHMKVFYFVGKELQRVFYVPIEK
ncbi:hypothetical protein [Cohnella herbarum]|uniref:Uncharacterized protein n=1 Tax=Cohnella herbarum TaxID=2728023 RepID=A0A7Z2VK58_9BACL|nr:hypothetical protein [Cohnella herbarum]QJD84374.1 hypothetical protein HH215_15110 [Cohnella herbarum]